MKKILFIVHEASETGAPLVINNLLNTSYSKENKCFVLSIYGGKIELNLRKNAQVSVLYEKGQSKGFFHKVIRKFFKPKNDYLKKLNNGFFDLVYINSIASLTRLPSLKFLKNNKSILHVHEGPILSENLGVQEIISKVIDNISSFIFVSEFAKNNFILNHSIAAAKCQVIPPVMRNVKKQAAEVKNLDLPENSFVVCSSGSLNYNKGVDVFLQVAKNVISQARPDFPVYFVWIGMHGNQEIRSHFFGDIKKMGLKNNILVIPNTDKIIDYFYESDLFLLCSREESFSMVAMENAIIGNPVICFDSGNGTAEFINNENGCIVPYLDVLSASQSILDLYNNPILLSEKSEAIKKIAIDFRGQSSSDKIFEIIKNVIDAR